MRTPLCWSAVGETIRKRSCLETDGGKRLLGNASLGIVSKVFFLSVYVDDIKMTGKKRNLEPMEKIGETR